MDRHARGKRNYCAGLAAEDVVRRRYSDEGYELTHSRWRGRSGEIDLIFRKGAEWVFAEVKASRDFARAAHAISTTQLSRILRAADEFLAGTIGHCDVDCRVDLALVDGQGRSHIVENVSMP
jgi:putative endonuclease